MTNPIQEEGWPASGSNAGRLPPARWSPWVQVEDRDELRRRLEHLAANDELDASQVEFVRYFFRASDPVLYPLAAAAVGRAVVGSDEVADEMAGWLTAYARSRGIELAGQVELAGLRARRRVLVAAAAGWARDRSGWCRVVASAEAEEEGGRGPLPPHPPLDHPADLAAYLRACRLLLDGTDPPDELGAVAWRVLEAVAHEPRRLRNVAVAGRWGELLAGARGSGTGLDADAARALGGRAVRALVAEAEGDGDAPGAFRPQDDVGRRLTRLRAAEAIIRGGGSVLAPLASLLPGVVGRAGASRGGRVEAGEGAWPGAESGAGDAADAPQREIFVRELATLTDPRRWWTLDAPGRARTAFVLLRTLGQGEAAPGELPRILDAHGLPAARGAVARVVLQLAHSEGVGPEHFVDATLLHGLEDPGLLLALVPHGPPGELGGVVADALEHRIRMGLAREPAFRPDALLARVEARDPHPAFYGLLVGVVGDRRYTRPDGSQVELAVWLQALAAEAHAARESGGTAVGLEPPAAGFLGELRRGVRAGLHEVAGTTHPRLLARRLLALVHGSPGEEAGVRRDLRTLLEAVHEEEAHDAEAFLHQESLALRSEAHRLVPVELDGLVEARSAGEGLRRELAGLRDQVAPWLPAGEARLMVHALGAADRAVDAWLQALEGAARAWRQSGWDQVLAAAAAVPDPEHRALLFPVVWRSLWRGHEREDERERLMRWAVEAGQELEGVDRDAWLEAVAADWIETVESAVAQGLETRVARLVRDPGPARLALLPGVDDVLERARIWLFDCYRLTDAARVTRVLNLRRGRGTVAALPRDSLAFFLHYSPVWLALLVGAILMLDFGDAWTAMAEVGDIRGIGITFVLGATGAFAYVTAELHARVRDAPGDRVWANRLTRVLRGLGFVVGCLVYTAAVVGLLWWLLSGTDEVVHGAGAVLHVVVWSGFALFVGVFFGLMAKAA